MDKHIVELLKSSPLATWGSVLIVNGGSTPIPPPDNSNTEEKRFVKVLLNEYMI